MVRRMPLTTQIIFFRRFDKPSKIHCSSFIFGYTNDEPLTAALPCPRIWTSDTVVGRVTGVPETLLGMDDAAVARSTKFLFEYDVITEVMHDVLRARRRPTYSQNPKTRIKLVS